MNNYAVEYLKKIWQYKRLILTFAKRDIKIQYAQTFLGLLWTIVQPLTALIIFTVFFSKLIYLPGIHSRYSIFVFSGLLIWNNFSYILGRSGTSLMENQHIIKKIYFPKLILPLSKVLVSWIEFSVSFVLMFLLLIISKEPLTLRIFALPLVLLLNVLLALSIAIWLSALTVRYRDFHHLIPFITGFGIWLTPVFYPTTIIPLKYSLVIYFNPVAGVIDLFRWVITGQEFELLYFLPSWFISFILLLLGYHYFIKIEKTITDTI